MKLTDLRKYDTVILYGMGFNGQSLVNRMAIGSFVPNIICWDRKRGEYNGYKITTPPVDFSCLANYGKYLIIVTPTIAEYMAEMIDNIPDEYNVSTLYSFEEYKDGFFTGNDGFVTEKGHCTSCESDVVFEKQTTINNLKGIGLTTIFSTFCPKCGSITRERATVDALNTFFPAWRCKDVHESSPSLSRIKAMQTLFTTTGEECGEYSYSYFYEDVPLGEYKGESRCENLEKLTFSNETIDYLITTDVFEHINSPLLAFAEIGRVLRKGGAHIFTIPYFDHVKTKFRVKEQNGKLLYLDKPQYHLNPINADGSLVTVDWGYDLGRYIWEASGMELLEYTCYKPIGREMFNAEIKVFISVKTK